jgi:hypothetical protein
MMFLGISLLALVVFFMYMWKTPETPKQGCSTCPSKKNADTY